MQRLAQAWRAFWEQAPRQLRFTRAGRVLVGIAFATGFAAVNTGNNLLYLCWGLVLATIILSGVLSEGVLRRMTLAWQAPFFARAGEATHAQFVMTNGLSRAVYAVHGVAVVRSGSTDALWRAPFVLRIGPRESVSVWASWTPQERGGCRVDTLVAETNYPFGFFTKSRRYQTSQVFWVSPAKVPVDDLALAAVGRAEESLSARAGTGEEFFGLRPYREGDDLRRVAFRPSAKFGRWVVRENEAPAGRTLLLELRVHENAEHGAMESAIARFASLAERLLEEGFAVGIIAGALFVPPAAGSSQNQRILGDLARWQYDAAARYSFGGLARAVTRIVVAMPGARCHEGESVVHLGPSPQAGKGRAA